MPDFKLRKEADSSYKACEYPIKKCVKYQKNGKVKVIQTSSKELGDFIAKLVEG